MFIYKMFPSIISCWEGERRSFPWLLGSVFMLEGISWAVKRRFFLQLILWSSGSSLSITGCPRHTNITRDRGQESGEQKLLAMERKGK